MTTIIFVFFVAFLSSLLLTPVFIRIAKRCNIVDVPTKRKVHDKPVPRLGGVALFLSFFVSLAVLSMNHKMFMGVAADDPRLPLFLIALTAAFLLGLWDDIRHLSSGAKFSGQLLIAVFSFYAGIKISIVSFPFVGALDLGYFALPVTVFWFLLAINAINLIDGLDGLAAGICLFVSMAMLVICLTAGRILEAIAFAALSGALIGFLRYNFHPASIFMEDSGSYFLGYFIAALSILGSIKGQVATAVLIPVIALGIPLIDTFFAPLRRFVIGQKMFQPDKSHLHHRLIKMGYSHRRAVLLIYGITLLLGIISIVMVHAKDESAALILMVLGFGVIFLGRYCGVMDFINADRIGRWFKDVSYESGLSHKRRIVLRHEIAIAETSDINNFWLEVCKALHCLEFDIAELALVDLPDDGSTTVPKNKGKNEENTVDKPDEHTFQESVLRLNWSRNSIAKPKDMLAQQGVVMDRAADNRG